MKRTAGDHHTRILLAFFTLLLGFLALANVLLVASLQGQFFKETQRHTRNELALATISIQEHLLKRDYQAVKRFLEQWAKQRPDVIELKAIGTSQNLLAHYRRPTSANHLFRINYPVNISGKVQLNLMLVKDNSLIEEYLSDIIFQLLLSSFATVTLFGFFLWVTIKRSALAAAKHTKAEQNKHNDYLKGSGAEGLNQLAAVNKLLKQQISQRQQVEQDLLEERNFVNTILATIGALVCVLDTKGRVVRFNRACEKTTGYEFNEVKGQSIWDLFIVPEEVDGVMHVFEDLRGGALPSHYENHWITKHGSRRLIRWSNTFIVDANENPQYVIGTGIDITEHKRARDALRESEERYRSLTNDVLDTSQVGICILDSNLRIVWVNQALERYFCIPREELIDNDEFQLVNMRIKHIFEDPQAFTQGILIGHEHYDKEQRFECHILPNEHRQERWLEYWSQPIRTGLYAGGRISQYYDITDRHRAEETLIQAQKMEAVGQLTGGVAHDFNNLLTIISGNMQILEQYFEDDPLCRKLIQGAENASKRGAELINKLLIFSRRQDLRPKAIDLNDLVVNITELLHRTLGENIEIETMCGEDLWKAQADPVQVETSLLNLAINARDAMPQGGKLTIEFSNARIDESYAARHVEVLPGDYVMLAVTDTGTGMSNDVMDHAFEPFYTTKKAGKGSGLGLSMVYGFVKQSAGHIKITSEPNQGTSVNIYLPRAKETPVSDRPSPRP